MATDTYRYVMLGFCLVLVGITSSCSQTPPREDDRSETQVRVDEAPDDSPIVTPVSAIANDSDGPIGNYCDPKNIRFVVVSRNADIRHCMTQSMEEFPPVERQVTVTWRIALDGTVTNAHISNSELEIDTLHECLVAVADDLRFKPPDGGRCDVNYPFIFTGLPESGEDQ